MLRKRDIIALLGVSMVAIWPTAASATNCPPRKPPYVHKHTTIGGSIVTTCTLTSTGSVVNEIQQDNLRPGPQLGADIVPFGHALLLCGDPGNNNLSPGEQVIEIPATVGSFSNYRTLTKSDGLGGAYRARVTASPLNYEQHFSVLQSQCPNDWIPFAYVPCNAIVQVQRKEYGIPTTYSKLSCTLDKPLTLDNECATLGYNATTRKFDARFYDCTVQE